MKKESIKTQIYRVKNSNVGFLVYELNNGKYYGRIMAAPLKITESERQSSKTILGELITEEKIQMPMY